MTATLQRFSLLITAIHDAGTDPGRWDEVIADITTAFGTVAGFLVIADPAGGRHSVHACGIGGQELRDRIDGLAERMARHPVRGLADAEFETPPTPSGLLAARLSADPPWSWICLESVDSQSDSDARTLLNALVPHLVQALRTRSRLAELAWERTLALATLEKARHGILIVAPDTALIFANSRAADLTADLDGLAVDAFGRLRATSPAAQPRLHRLIADAAGPAGMSGSLALTRPSVKRPLTIHAGPLDGQPQHRAVLLLVFDPEHDPGLPPTTLHELYGLTETESLVARGVLRGDGLPAVAAQLCVSLSTARTHLQHIFVKTGTHRQAELVRLLATVALAAQ
ncbi:helix-turn-helix transcriptional regulator [Nocardia huaxiensis]|uniref:helix-turn-helix transcriptional regulator n=1 Tax=Nocardia huaxiensis TaxID=2755382 RepID=UPI001E392CA5|nr:helix-turn-helix transcriptional regulator [Nocardia huaxiensis]UFS99368.1 helix-turn-helix transcriptional regulator [Nocardia huaxiensis]